MKVDGQDVNITLLDGGMGRELLRLGAPFRQPEWSALALMEAPEIVRKAHQNFAEAGCDILTTSNYAVVPFMLAREGLEVAADLATMLGDIDLED